jgi:hypothetical protein
MPSITNNKQNNLVSQRDDSVVLRTVKRINIAKHASLMDENRLRKSKGLCRTHGGGKHCQYPDGWL